MKGYECREVKTPKKSGLMLRKDRLEEENLMIIFIDRDNVQIFLTCHTILNY